MIQLTRLDGTGEMRAAKRYLEAYKIAGLIITYEQTSDNSFEAVVATLDFLTESREMQLARITYHLWHLIRNPDDHRDPVLRASTHAAIMVKDR